MMMQNSMKVFLVGGASLLAPLVLHGCKSDGAESLDVKEGAIELTCEDADKKTVSVKGDKDGKVENADKCGWTLKLQDTFWIVSPKADARKVDKLNSQKELLIGMNIKPKKDAEITSIHAPKGLVVKYGKDPVSKLTIKDGKAKDGKDKEGFAIIGLKEDKDGLPTTNLFEISGDFTPKKPLLLPDAKAVAENAAYSKFKDAGFATPATAGAPPAASGAATDPKKSATGNKNGLEQKKM